MNNYCKQFIEKDQAKNFVIRLKKQGINATIKPILWIKYSIEEEKIEFFTRYNVVYKK